MSKIDWHGREKERRAREEHGRAAADRRHEDLVAAFLGKQPRKKPMKNYAVYTAYPGVFNAVILGKGEEDNHKAITDKIIDKEMKRKDFEWPRELTGDDFPYMVVMQQPSKKSAIGVAKSSKKLKYRNPFVDSVIQPSKP